MQVAGDKKELLRQLGINMALNHYQTQTSFDEFRRMAFEMILELEAKVKDLESKIPKDAKVATATLE